MLIRQTRRKQKERGITILPSHEEIQPKKVDTIATRKIALERRWFLR